MKSLDTKRVANGNASGNTKENILQVALRLFAKRGYGAVSVRDIAEKLGMTQGALYKHYRSKRDLFDSIVNRMRRQDHDRAESFGVPMATLADSPAEYERIDYEPIREFAMAQFLYWTEDEMACAFRRLLILEQYSTPEMGKLYEDYLAGGVLAYLEDLFLKMREQGKLRSGLPRQLALEFYAPLLMLMNLHDRASDTQALRKLAGIHLDDFAEKHVLKSLEKTRSVPLTQDMQKGQIMDYPRSKKYQIPAILTRIMGPNPIKLLEELMLNHQIRTGANVLDLGSGQGVTSLFLAKEYGFRVYAADLWSDPQENQAFFDARGVTRDQIIPVKADASSLPFPKCFFDAVVSVDSYNYFGRDSEYLDRFLLPLVKPGGPILIAIPGLVKDCHDDLPKELLLSWTPDQLAYMHDVEYWRAMVSQSNAEVVSVTEMVSNEEVWADWLRCENEYALNDRKTLEAGGGRFLNFIAMVLRKKAVQAT